MVYELEVNGVRFYRLHLIRVSGPNFILPIIQPYNPNVSKWYIFTTGVQLDTPIVRLIDQLQSEFDSNVVASVGRLLENHGKTVNAVGRTLGFNQFDSRSPEVATKEASATLGWKSMTPDELSSCEPAVNGILFEIYWAFHSPTGML